MTSRSPPRAPLVVLIIHIEPATAPQLDLEQLLQRDASIRVSHHPWNGSASAANGAFDEDKPGAVVLAMRQVTFPIYRLVKKLREKQGKDVPVVVVAYEDRPEHAALLFSGGATGFVHGRLPATELARHLEQAVRGRKLVAVPNPSDWLAELM